MVKFSIKSILVGVTIIALLLPFLLRLIPVPSDTDLVDANIAEIEAELSSLSGHSWAGIYESRDRQTTFWLGVKTGFAHLRYESLGIYGQHCGTVVVADSWLEFSETVADGHHMNPWLEGNLSPVQIGERVFLVPPRFVDGLEDLIRENPLAPWLCIERQSQAKTKTESAKPLLEPSQSASQSASH